MTKEKVSAGDISDSVGGGGGGEKAKRGKITKSQKRPSSTAPTIALSPAKKHSPGTTTTEDARVDNGGEKGRAAKPSAKPLKRASSSTEPTTAALSPAKKHSPETIATTTTQRPAAAKNKKQAATGPAPALPSSSPRSLRADASPLSAASGGTGASGVDAEEETEDEEGVGDGERGTATTKRAAEGDGEGEGKEEEDSHILDRPPRSTPAQKKARREKRAEQLRYGYLPNPVAPIQAHLSSHPETTSLRSPHPRCPDSVGTSC